jgi:endoglucanase
LQINILFHGCRRFFEGQASGVLPAWNRAARANGGWRGDAHTRDGFGPGGVGRDLSGGWYEGSGNHTSRRITSITG